MQIQWFNYTHLSGEALHKLLEDYGSFFLIDVFFSSILVIFLCFCVFYLLPYVKIYGENMIKERQKLSKKNALQKILVQKEIETEIENEIEEDTKKELAKKFDQQ